MPRVFGFVWEATPIALLLTLSLNIVTALIPAGIVWMIKIIVDGVVATVEGGMEWHELLPSAFVILALWAIQSVCGSVLHKIKNVLSEPLGFFAEERLARKVASLDLAAFDSHRLQDWLHMANGEFYRLGHITLASIQLPCGILGMFVAFGLLATLHPLAVVVVVATVVPRILMEGHVARREFSFVSVFVRYQRMIDYLRTLLITRSSAKEVRAFSVAGPLLGRYRNYADALIRVYRRLLEEYVKLEAIFDLLALVGVFSVWIYAIHEAAMSRITLGDLALVFQVSQQAQGQMKGLISAAGNIYGNSLFIRRFLEFLDIDPPTIDGALSRPVGEQKSFRLCREISLRSVSFKYPSSDRWVLRDVTFDIPVGKRVAIVGENGVGKSTLVKLLCRLYDPVEGRVLVDDTDLRQICLADVRRKVGVTFQDFLRYEFTVADNIELGPLRGDGERDRVVRAAAAAGAAEFVEQLEKRYQTVLGRTMEDGVDLSGGEWQALALARAYVKDPEVLVLDEPTAALDALAEHRLFEQIASTTQDNTVVFISHRFSTVRLADIIVVLANGRVSQTGSHEELMSEGGVYRTMFLAQASRYAD